MLKGTIRFFVILLFLSSTPAVIPVLDSIVTGTGMDVFAHTRSNHAPVAEDQNVQTEAGKEKVIVLQAIDPDGDHLKYQIVNPPQHGELKGKPPGMTYIPGAGFHGSDRFTFKVSDGQEFSNVATIRIKVMSVNHAPHARKQKVKTRESQPVEIILRARDRDGDSLTFQIVDYPTHGTLNGTPPVVTYTPNPGYQGSDKFTFKVNDGKLDSNVAIVSISVIKVHGGNHTPVAQNQSVSTNEATPKAITLLATDSDEDTLTYQVIVQPAQGTLSGSPPSVTYTPSSGYRGPDSFTFKANDGKVDSNTATVSITVVPMNHAPVAQNQNVSMDEGTAKAISLSATDSDGDTLTYVVVSQPAHGGLSGTAPNVTYTPISGYHGPDNFTFKVSDGKADSNIAIVSITILAVNHAPAAQNQTVTTDEGTAKGIALLATDSDGDTLTYQVISPPGHGTLSGSPPSVTFTPSSGYRGPDSFTFKANDGKVDSNVAAVSVTVLAVNHASVAQNQSVSTEEGVAKAITLMATDSDGDPLTYQVVFQPSNGTLSGTPPGITYTPNARYQGSDSFTFSAYDGQAYSNAAMVSITVTPAENRLSITFPQDGGTIQRPDIRVEGKIVSTGGETGVVVNGILANVYGDTFVANHVPLVEGTNTITATATDGQGNRATITVTVNVVPAKDYIRMRASSEVGIGPFETTLTLDSSLDLANAPVTYEGTGEVELVKTDTKEYRVNIPAEGIYTFTARVSDSTGTLYEDKIDIIAVSKADLENRLVSRWEGMKGALLGGNIEAALTFFVPGMQDRYRQVFEKLGSERMNSIFTTIIGVELDTCSGRSAEGGIIREENEKIYSYPVTFVRDQNGIWKIMGF